MSAVNITSIAVLDNPAAFTSPITLEVHYDALYRLEGDLEFKLIYVGSAEDPTKDQVLDEVLLGPVEPGQYRFVFQADAPDPAKIPQDDLVGVTVVLLTCSYRDQEFIRVGYYVASEYMEEELRENPPEAPLIDKLYRNILADKPRVTRFPINFDAPPGESLSAAPDAGMDATADAGVDTYAAAADADAYHGAGMGGTTAYPYATGGADVAMDGGGGGGAQDTDMSADTSVAAGPPMAVPGGYGVPAGAAMGGGEGYAAGGMMLGHTPVEMMQQ